MRRVPFLVIAGAAGLAALLALGAVSGLAQGDGPTVATQTFENVVTYTIPTETETVTTEVTVTVTEPAPTTTGPPTTTTEPGPPGEAIVCLVSNRDTWQLAGVDCAAGTEIRFTNEQFRCNAPLASYGELPLRLVWEFTGNPNFGDQGHLMFGSGCRGDTNPDTVDVIVVSNADGLTVGACGGAGKFQQSPGPQDIQITGNFDAGPLCGGAHQDVWQFHPTNNPANIDIVNGTSGDYDAGLSTTIGAGGAVFFSAVYDVDVYGGEYVTCNHGYFGHSSPFNQVVDAKFRTGRTDGTDPKCVGIFSSDPCVGAATFVNVTAERWVGGQWVTRPCRS